MAEVGLRIGVVGEAGKLRHWQVQCLQALLEVPEVEMAFFAECASSEQRRKSSILYQRWLKRRAPATALSLAVGPSLLTKIPHIPLGDDPSAAELEKLRGYHPDLILQFSPGELPPSIRELPGLGIWRFVFGERLHSSDEVPGLYETLHDIPIAMASLQRSYSDPVSGADLRSGCFGVGGHSAHSIAETVLQSCANWPAQVCRAFLAGNTEAVVGAGAEPLAPSAPSPTNAEMLRLWWRELRGDHRSRKASRATFEEWNFGVLPHPVSSLLEEKPNFNVRWLPSPGHGQGRSTPFGYVKDGKLSVLYEKYDASKDKGVIGRLRPKRDNNLKRSRVVLQATGHLSYPFVLEHEGAVLVIPENPQGGQVELYRLDEEQTALTRTCTLLNEPLLSPTLFQHDGRWWLFGTRAPLENTALYAYHAERMEGPYSPHTLNPIKTDIRSARPGGTLFRHGNALWRPAQDHSVSPAGRIALNRVMELTPGRFTEETVKFIGPVKGTWSHGIRTLSMIGDLTLVDGMRRTSGKAGKKSDRTRDKRKGREREPDDSDDL